MGIYDRDWWRERYNQRTGHSENRNAEWQKPKNKPRKQPPEGRVFIPIRKPRGNKLRPSLVGPILLWATIIVVVFGVVKAFTK